MCVCVCVDMYVHTHSDVAVIASLAAMGDGGWLGKGMKCGCRDARVDVASTRDGDVHACDF